MSCKDELVKVKIQLLVSRIERIQAERSLDITEKLVIKLNKQFPGDSGIFAALVLNHIFLRVGESFFIGPNEPHAYIYGDCIECMALSDNVVRAGLTPKFKDVETLCSMLTYK